MLGVASGRVFQCVCATESCISFDHIIAMCVGGVLFYRKSPAPLNLLLGSV